MTQNLMILGTMSNVGKSFLTAGLLRVFRQDGYRVAPFKSQNMALNSYITADGLEMGRAQVVQAEAAGIEPDVAMNPILLKPTNDVGSQVIVNGRPIGNMPAREYFRYKIRLLPDIRRAYDRLASVADLIVVEGAGSPAEINLKENDIVNLGLAKAIDAPALLVGDIDRGGVFAQLYGTVALLSEEERSRIRGLVINKFRGDKTILDPGIRQIEEACGIPVVGVVPYTRVDIEDEDSLSPRLSGKMEVAAIDIAVIRLPRISNFTDFNRLEQIDGVSLRYVDRPEILGSPDLIILPGTKNTMGDLLELRQNGLEARILKAYAAGTPVIGVCGGYQMLGEEIRDPYGTERGGAVRGMGLLPVRTVFAKEKTRARVRGTVCASGGVFAQLAGATAVGYEIHMGRTFPVSEKTDGLSPFLTLALERSQAAGDRGMPAAGRRFGIAADAPAKERGRIDSANGSAAGRIGGYTNGLAYGTYVHGFFDREEIVAGILKGLAEKKGIAWEEIRMQDYRAYREEQYDKLADVLRGSLDMERIYRIVRREM